MKTLLIFLLPMLQSFAMADNTELRIIELENKVQALEKALNNKLGKCELTYKHFAYRLNVCDQGTFPRSITKVGDTTLQLECGYYQLQCSINQQE